MQPTLKGWPCRLQLAQAGLPPLHQVSLHHSQSPEEGGWSLLQEGRRHPGGGGGGADQGAWSVAASGAAVQPLYTSPCTQGGARGQEGDFWTEYCGQAEDEEEGEESGGQAHRGGAGGEGAGAGVAYQPPGNCCLD